MAAELIDSSVSRGRDVQNRYRSLRRVALTPCFSRGLNANVSLGNTERFRGFDHSGEKKKPLKAVHVLIPHQHLVEARC
jgi:hypothetical protein